MGVSVPSMVPGASDISRAVGAGGRTAGRPGASRPLVARAVAAGAPLGGAAALPFAPGCDPASAPEVSACGHGNHRGWSPTTVAGRVPWEPWRFTAADYEAAVVSGPGRPLGGAPGPTPWDPPLAEVMTRRGVRVEEENVLPGLLDDLGSGEP
ncbi:Protein of unknown function C-terminus [Nocardiopsis flavescens]|uniref:DUF2399 domain-containing protein n=1 Tax=Nocardiopsis flavescens TaxID=758803 RepID=A0A1M6SW80_9ACTN|nr:Protein of unknown function C-terminus [Nocardiopsis flavescens]